MRLNQFIARSTGCSRRQADRYIEQGKVTVNGQPASVGQPITETDKIELDGQTLALNAHRTIMLHKPIGYVVSRDGQGSPTIYDLLPPELDELKPVGRLDKDSSGLLLLTNDGELANRLTHPRYKKLKRYEVSLAKPLSESDLRALAKGVELTDGISRLDLQQHNGKNLVVSMAEGRKRQIRRTFQDLGHTVTRLHRIQFGGYTLPPDLAVGHYRDQ